tara:strand:+ start:132 stop:689 length:558 start_codon:yes stop_codon:yes gene_type:complete
MRVFVLSPQRCGSVTFSAACSHIKNFTSGHETREKLEVQYPDNHIEVDNRLAFFLGRIEKKYGDNAYYVFLKRDPEKVANSCLNRYNKGIMRGYHKRILLFKPDATKLDVCRDYVKTVNANIEVFLKNKTKKMDVHVENFEKDFNKFWSFIGAKGSKEDALKELNKKHNTSKKYKLDYIKNNIFK